MDNKLLKKIGYFVAAFISPFLLYKIAVVLSNFIIGKEDDNRDPHGIPAVYLGVLLSVVFIILIKSGFKGRLDISDLRGADTAPSSSQSALSNNSPYVRRGFSTPIILALLTGFFCLNCIFSEGIFQSVYAAATDKSIIEITLTPLQAEKLTATIGGSVFYVAFFPMTAILSFMAGMISWERISYKLLLVPSFAVYSLINFLEYQQTGQPKVVSGVLHLIAVSSDQQATVTSDGVTGLIWFVAAICFIGIIMLLNCFVWLFFRLGFSTSKRLPKVYITNPDHRLRA